MVVCVTRSMKVCMFNERNGIMPIKHIDGLSGLHEIQSSVNQMTYMETHSIRLLELLDVVMERTYSHAPRRAQSYILDRSERRNPVKQQRERLLEKAIWMQWNNDVVGQRKASFQNSLCRHIQTFQMPLQGTRADKSWGKIDLVGATDAGLPTVLELKRESAADTPLRMLVEGLAYAVAVRKAWNEGHLRREWAKFVTSLFR